MMTNPSTPLGTHKEKQILFEIGSYEKHLWSLIHSKGLLHSDSQGLYRKVRSSYERTILNNHSHSELQDAEYCLWKLHYMHIDEFRKRIKKCSGNAENNRSVLPQDGVVKINNDNHIKAFSSFLSEATEFYQTLIVKLRKHYGAPEEALFYKKGWVISSSDPEAMMKCQYLCHRCLVCMGDLARYKQQYESFEIQNQNWSVAAIYYLEATRIWPDSGNPQNQLAVLATYIGDDFLALYFCVRSLAVKEPFPDAWDNLIFLLEKNRSSHLQYVASEVCFDFYKPSARITKEIKAQPNDDTSNNNKGEINLITDTKLWSLFVRTISFLFIRSSLEEFPLALASTISVLDTMMELEDIELNTILDSYEQMDLARKGPFRALQVVAILIFSLKNLIDGHEKIESKDKKDCQQLVLIHMALSAAFSIMGRFIERCLKATHLKACPLFPSVLVFVEWCASMLDATEVYATDQKSMRAISYFFDVLVELLNQLNDSGKETKKLPDNTPLWEDYELRGFVPVACSHLPLDFSSTWDLIDNFESGIELRSQRMTEAAMKIASRSTNLQKWITCDALGRKFFVARPDEDRKKNKETKNVVSNDNSTRGEEHNQKTHLDADEYWKISITNGKSFEVEEEEEEVILFRPLIRYNSAPPYPTISSDEWMPPKDKDHQSLPSYDSMHGAASLLMEQKPSQGDPWGFHGDIVNFRSNKSYKQQEGSMMKESNEHTISEGVIFAGPPSLSSWVLDRGSLINNRSMGTNGLISQQRLHLNPIDEAASSYLAGLSINQNENSVVNRPNESSNFPSSSATCYAPVPSAPLLQDNAAWITDVQSTFPAPLLPNNTSPISGYAGWSCTHGTPGYDPSFSAYSSGFVPQPGRMTSSEWLHWYRENYTLDRVNNQMQPTTLLNVPGNHENYVYHDTHRFNQYDRWGNDPLPSNQYTYMEPLGPPQLQPVCPYDPYGATEHNTNLLKNNFQRLSPYGSGGAVTEQRSEPQTLLEYLKEKEWQLQRGPTLRGPTFMGN